MKVAELPLHQLREAPWNSNQMDEDMMARLGRSIGRYGLVENLVVRPVDTDTYEVLSGNQRLKLLKELTFSEVPCVVVDLDDANARLLAQALNHIQGEDDLGLRAELVRKALETVTGAEVLDLLPETAESLDALASMGHETMAEHLQAWQQAQAARLRHMQFQFTDQDLPLVEQALEEALKKVKGKADNPNVRSRAMVVICESFLKSKRLYASYRRRTP